MKRCGNCGRFGTKSCDKRHKAIFTKSGDIPVCDMWVDEEEVLE